MKIFKKIFKIKRDLTHGERVSAAKQQAQVALGMFTTAHNQLEEANTELAIVANEARNQANELMKEAQRKSQELLRHAENAHDEIGMNKAVQVKLKDFVVPQKV